MGAPLATSYDVTVAKPIDDRMWVGTGALYADRASIPALKRWVGMTVYDKNDDITYQLVAGITDSDWQVVGSGGGGGGGSTEPGYQRYFLLMGG